MNPKLRSAVFGERFARLRLAVGCVAAVVLPWLSTLFSLTTEELRRTPMALCFAMILLVTVLCGLVPGVLAGAVTGFLFNYLVLARGQGFLLDSDSAVGTAVVLGLGVLVAFLSQRQGEIGKRLRQTMQSLQARTDSLIEAQQASKSVAWTFHTSNKKMIWEEGGAEIFGRPFAELEQAGEPIQLVVEEDRAKVDAAVDAAIASGLSFEVEFRVCWPDGEIHWLETRGFASPQDGKTWRGVTIDITERKKAEHALIRSEKLAAVGRLSATVAHEINNPLEALTNLLFLASLDLSLSEQTRRHLQQAEEEVARLAAIARHTLTFVRPKAGLGPSDVIEVVQNVKTLFEPRCRTRGAPIDLIVDGDERVHAAMTAGDLRQVLTNLISNACDALPETGGKIELEIQREAERVTIFVRDNGTGIDAKNVTRIFDPFFTTKPEVGTGIGLWVTRALTENAGGRVQVKVDGVADGYATEFQVELPVV